MTRLRFTEYLDLDLDDEMWCCNRCGVELTSARNPYKQGCLVHDRDPREIHPPIIEGDYTFSPDPEWVRILEFYCPGCGAQVETEYLPPGHPITVDIEVDVDRLQARIAAGEVVVADGRLVVANRSGNGGPSS
jgi:acetophenone carboxylase